MNVDEHTEDTMCRNTMCQTCKPNNAERDMPPDHIWNSDRDNRENPCESCVISAACRVRGTVAECGNIEAVR